MSGHFDELDERPACSLTRRGKVADDLRAHPIYFLLRNVAVFHAKVILQLKHDDVLDSLVEESVSEVLMTLRRNTSITRQEKALKKQVCRAFNRIYRQWKRREHPVEVEDSDQFDFRPKEPLDPRDFAVELVSKVDRDREISILNQKLSELVSPSELIFLKWYVDRDDEHDPPHTAHERQRFCRLLAKVKAHLQHDLAKFQCLLDWN